MQPPVPSTVPGSSSVTTQAGVPSRPGLFNGATVHGIPGIRGLRHPAEIPLLIASVLTTLLAYGTWVIIVSWLASSSDATGVEAELRSLFLERGTLSQALLIIPLFPLLVWIIRALLYAQLRASSVQMSPTDRKAHV